MNWALVVLLVGTAGCAGPNLEGDHRSRSQEADLVPVVRAILRERAGSEGVIVLKLPDATVRELCKSDDLAGFELRSASELRRLGGRLFTDKNEKVGAVLSFGVVEYTGGGKIKILYTEYKNVHAGTTWDVEFKRVNDEWVEIRREVVSVS